MQQLHYDFKIFINESLWTEADTCLFTHTEKTKLAFSTPVNTPADEWEKKSSLQSFFFSISREVGYQNQ